MKGGASVTIIGATEPHLDDYTEHNPILYTFIQKLTISFSSYDFKECLWLFHSHKINNIILKIKFYIKNHKSPTQINKNHCLQLVRGGLDALFPIHTKLSFIHSSSGHPSIHPSIISPPPQ